MTIFRLKVVSMRQKVLPPGTILTMMYLKERLKLYTPGRFIEIGPGSGGIISKILLDLGWRGVSYELNHDSSEILKQKFAVHINKNQYQVKNEDWLTEEVVSDSTDLIISCMVLEHLPSVQEGVFFEKAYNCLSSNGVVITIVPASQKHWGIEDDIAGHFRRYSTDMILKLLDFNKWTLNNSQGLTYPISNILLPISNYLVRRGEKSQLNLSQVDKTKKLRKPRCFNENKFSSDFKSVT